MTWGKARTGRWIILSCALALMVSCESSRTAFARLTGQLVIGGDAVLAEAQPQQAYRAALVVTGGEAPYRWSLRDGLDATIRAERDVDRAGCMRRTLFPTAIMTGNSGTIGEVDLRPHV